MKKAKQQLLNNHSNEEYQELEEALLKKDREITKLRQAKELLQGHND